jgi:hypothetical protein
MRKDSNMFVIDSRG